MNTYAWIILIAIIVSFLLDLVSDLLNLKTLNDDLPDEFKGVYEEEKYRKAQEYSAVKIKAGQIQSVVNLIAFLAFWFFGGFKWLSDLVDNMDLGSITSGLVFIGILVGFKTVLSLPFSIYSNFVIEEKFGFNRTTVGTFIGDRIKGLVLMIIIGGSFLSLILYLLEAAGDWAWLWGWGATVVFSLALQIIFPIWIMPLFNKFKTLEEGELREKITQYAQKVNFPLTNIFEIDGSKRSSKSNAFFAGFGKSKRLALYDTLIEQQDPDELVAVVAHEVGHFKHKHVIQGMVISIVHSGLLFYLLSIFLSHEGLFNAFYLDTPTIYAGLVFFGLLLQPLDLLISVGFSALSRKNEFEADRYAATTIDNPEHMVNALMKLSRDNLVHLTPHWLQVFLHHSHPPILERIRAIRNI